MSRYYPIGTVVKLELYDVLHFMIAGYLPKTGDGRVYDYFGVLFPFGILDEAKCICFNHNSITEMVHEGFCSEECSAVLDGFEEFGKKMISLSYSIKLTEKSKLSTFGDEKPG